MILFAMPDNASYVVHHYFENASYWYTSVMACCIALIVIIILVLLIILGLVVYVLVIKLKNSKPTETQSRQSSRPTGRRSDDLIDQPQPSSCNAVTTPASTVMQDLDMDLNSNVQSIPMSTLRKVHRMEDRAADLSGSSLGLYDVLFPSEHEGEVIFQPPSKLVSVDGEVFASTRKNSRVDLNLGPSSAGINCDTVSGSMEWDYYQPPPPTPYSASQTSMAGSETEKKEVIDVCWV